MEYQNLNSFFSNKLKTLKCDNYTKAYIVSIFAGYKTSSKDYSKNSITLLYTEAKFKQDFYMFQNIGDWLFMVNSLYPEHLNNASIDYYYSIGQLSYYSCYKLINKQCKLYEKLADFFPTLSLEVGNIIRKP